MTYMYLVLYIIFHFAAAFRLLGNDFIGLQKISLPARNWVTVPVFIFAPIIILIYIVFSLFNKLFSIILD